MAHFAKIENGVVTSVVVVNNEHEANGEKFLNDLGLDGKWIQTSYNGNIRGKYAAIGDIYDAKKDEFVTPPPPKPAPVE
jgi:hypothetical protein